MSVITINHVTKSFGDVTVLKEFTEEFQDGEFITFLGPSGCGKTTMLRIIAGFEKPTTGEIRIDGRVVSSRDVFVPPEKRGIGMVFQSYAVWPHMNVFDNVAYPLKIQKVPKAEIREKVEEILEIVHLSQYATRMPSQLSGGQQQRVAIARTLATEPKVLFMDEPLSNLDAKLRMDMRTELKRLHLETRSTFVYVTHDQLEAMTLSTKICLMKKGLLQQYAPPLTVYHSPANMFTADFVGNPSINLIEGVGSNINLDEIKIQVGDLNMLFCPESNSVSLSGNHKIVLGIRPEYVNIEADSALQASIYSTLPSGMETIVKIQLGDLILTSVVFQGKDFTVGETVGVEFTGERCVLFDAETEDYLALGRLEVIAG